MLFSLCVNTWNKFWNTSRAPIVHGSSCLEFVRKDSDHNSKMLLSFLWSALFDEVYRSAYNCLMIILLYGGVCIYCISKLYIAKMFLTLSPPLTHFSGFLCFHCYMVGRGIITHLLKEYWIPESKHGEEAETTIVYCLCFDHWSKFDWDIVQKCHFLRIHSLQNMHVLQIWHVQIIIWQNIMVAMKVSLKLSFCAFMIGECSAL